MICGKEYQWFDPCTECPEPPTQSFLHLLQVGVSNSFESLREKYLNKAFVADLLGNKDSSIKNYKILRILQLWQYQLNLIAEQAAMYFNDELLVGFGLKDSTEDDYIPIEDYYASVLANDCPAEWFHCNGMEVGEINIDNIINNGITAYAILSGMSGSDCYVY